MKIREYASDVAIVTGCAVGVGYISGKEAQVFFGGEANVAVFGAAFFAASIVLREYCRKNKCRNMAELAKACFGRFANAFNAALCLCCFVCIVTALAGLQQCLDEICYVSKLPLYALAAAVIATVAPYKGEKSLASLNAVAIAFSVVLFVLLFLKGGASTSKSLSAHPLKPVVYALFTLTTSSGVLTRLSCASSKKRNVICSAVSSAALSAGMVASIKLSDFNLPLPTLSGIDNPYVTAFAAVALTLAAVTGIVANAYPIIEEITPLTEDRTLACITLFGAALIFSFFGFDFAVKIGYVLVAVIGLTVIATCVVQLKTRPLLRTAA